MHLAKEEKVEFVGRVPCQRHLLLVEDDALLASAIVLLLRRRTTWVVDVARNGNDAMERLLAAQYAAVVLDWNLPSGPSGLQVCSWIRTQSISIGILFVSGRAAIKDRLAAFDAGADDYLVKPFEDIELLARLHALARRCCTSETRTIDPRTVPVAPILAFGTISIDLLALVVTVFGQGDIHVPLQEYRLLVYLMRNLGRAVSEDELRERALHTTSEPEGSTVRTLVHALRKRLGEAGSVIRRVRGVGYGIGLAP